MTAPAPSPLLGDWLLWFSAAVLSLVATLRALRHDTPIDDALPWIVLALILVAWAAGREAIVAAVPLLIGGELLIAAEPVRLLFFGLVVAASFALALWSLHQGAPASGAPASAGPRFPIRPMIVALSAILILRWIPFADVMIVRELVLLGMAAAIVILLRGTPAAIAIAVVTALLTVGVPRRTFLLPLLVVAACAGWRALRLRAPRLPVLATGAVSVVMLFFAWSGVVARSWRVLLRPDASVERGPGAYALGPGESVLIDLPPEATHLVLSGANAARLPEGTVLGRIDPGAIPVRIGDVADWGSMRREQFARTTNPFPADPAGDIRGYGYSAWLYGSGRVPVPPVPRVRVSAERTLPADVRLQIDAIELRR